MPVNRAVPGNRAESIDDLGPEVGGDGGGGVDDGSVAAAGDDIAWLSTKAAARRLGITPRTLYRFIDEGQLAAYRFGRVIRLKQSDVDAYIERCRIQPGTLEHLYPETVDTQGG